MGTPLLFGVQQIQQLPVVRRLPQPAAKIVDAAIGLRGASTGSRSSQQIVPFGWWHKSEFIVDEIHELSGSTSINPPQTVAKSGRQLSGVARIDALVQPGVVELPRPFNAEKIEDRIQQGSRGRMNLLGKPDEHLAAVEDFGPALQLTEVISEENMGRIRETLLPKDFGNGIDVDVR